MEKIERLKYILKRLERVVVAYSGGLDSAFLLKVAVDALGRENVLAVTARSETYPESECREAVRIAKRMGAKLLIIDTYELSSKKFTSNPVNRCYYCKKELFKKLDDIKKKYGMNYVLDGINFGDLKDVRHGRKAAAEFGVRSPLLEAGIGKPEIRKLSKKLKLETWDKPSFACLASRIPFDTEITKSALKRVGRAEDYIRSLGISQVRVRLHDKIARIEVRQSDLPKVMRHRSAITRCLKRLGFIYITLDLAGYRTGSMHEAS